MKRLTAALLILLMLIPNIVFAEEQQELRTITKEYQFTATSHVFEYEPQKEIKEDGIKYQFKSIDYELIGETDLFVSTEETFTHEIEQLGMSEKDDTVFAEFIEVTEEGFEGEIPLKEITYTEILITGRTASDTKEYAYGLQSTKPIPPDTLDVLYHDDETNSDVLATLNFLKLKESNAQWEDNIHVEQTYRSIYEDEYLLIDGIRLFFNSDKPDYEGFEDELLAQMRLKKESYRIVDSKWLGEAQTSDGQTIRVARYIVNRYVKDYTGIYTGSFDLPNIIAYDGKAVYEGVLENQEPNGKEYLVKAIVTYEQIPQPVKKNIAPIVAGASGGVIGLCGLVFFLIKKRNNTSQ